MLGHVSDRAVAGTRTSPVTRAPGGYSPSSARPVVVLPLPEAPTSAVTSPGGTRRLTPSTMRPAADLDAQVRDLRQHGPARRSRAAAGSWTSSLSARGFSSAASKTRLRAHRQGDDQQGGHHHGPGLDEQPGAVAVHHDRPVGGVRRDADAEEGGRRHQVQRAGQPDAGVGGEGAQRSTGRHSRRPCATRSRPACAAPPRPAGRRPPPPPRGRSGRRRGC